MPSPKVESKKTVVFSPSGNHAVFPELPFPLNHISVGGRDLNSPNGPKGTSDFSAFETEGRVKPAVEVGISFSF